MSERLSAWLLATGRWDQILPVLGVPAKALNGRNGPCIFCGGKDRARFTNHNDHGYYFCNQCGNYNGMQLLMKLHGWDFKKVYAEVDRVLGTNAMVSMSREHYADLLAQDRWDNKVHKSTKDAAWYLKNNHPERLDAWLDSRHPEVRLWWESQ